MIVEIILANLFAIYLIISLVRLIKSYIASNNKSGFLKSRRVLMAAVLVIHFVHGKQLAVQFFWENLFAFGYFFIYIIFSHNRFKIVHGYMAPINATANFFIPPLKHS